MSFKTVYLYHEINGEYIGPYDAQEEPNKKGSYIAPTHSTSNAPPNPGKNQVPVFKSGAWSLDDDYRGQTIYDQSTGATELVADIGPIPSGFALTPPVSSIRAAQNRKLSAAYEAAIYADITYKTEAGVAQTFQADDASQKTLNKLLSAYVAAGGVPASFYWVAVDNTQVPFTLADMQGLAKAMADRGWPEFQHLQNQKAAVRDAVTPADIQKINW